MGRAYKRSDDVAAQVSALTSFGVPQDEIAGFLGISDDTLRKYYAPEIARAATDRNAKVAAFLFRSASGETIPDGASYSDCLRAAMFWLKTRAGWRETQSVELSGPGGGPVETKTSIDASRLSTDALREVLAAMEAADADPGDGGGQTGV